MSVLRPHKSFLVVVDLYWTDSADTGLDVASALRQKTNGGRARYPRVLPQSIIPEVTAIDPRKRRSMRVVEDEGLLLRIMCKLNGDKWVCGLSSHGYDLLQA